MKKFWKWFTRDWSYRVFKSTFALRLAVRTTLGVLGIWVLVLIFVNADAICGFLWFSSDAETLRAVLGSAFQGLAAFFAIIISISLAVTQMAYGSFSPRLLRDFFLKDRQFFITAILFILALSLNLILLSFVSAGTARIIAGFVLIDLVLSLGALISVIPSAMALLQSIDPMNIGWGLIKKFDDAYFDKIESVGGRKGPMDDSNLPLLQTLIVRAIKEADTDYAQRLIGSFEEKLLAQVKRGGAKIYARYFNSFFKKIIFTASEEREGDILEQLIFVNERLEEEASKSADYRRSSGGVLESPSFAQNIIFISENAIINDSVSLLGTAWGAMARLRTKIAPLMPADDEIATFRTVKHFQKKTDSPLENTPTEFEKEQEYENINRTYFQYSGLLAQKALEVQNIPALHRLVRDIFFARHDLERLNTPEHKEAVKRISYALLFSLKSITHPAIEKGINIANEVASGTEESADFFLAVDPKLAEGFVDLLGELMVEMVNKKLLNNDPNATIYWAGVALRMFLVKGKGTPAVALKLLGYFEDIFKTIETKQKAGKDPMLEKLKETAAEEVVSLRNYPDSDSEVLKKAEEIISKYCPSKAKTS
ncbi:MAG: hypothetical protein V4436_00960 [Patescibacteria group bacterium]